MQNQWFIETKYSKLKIKSAAVFHSNTSNFQRHNDETDTGPVPSLSGIIYHNVSTFPQQVSAGTLSSTEEPLKKSWRTFTILTPHLETSSDKNEWNLEPVSAAGHLLVSIVETIYQTKIILTFCCIFSNSNLLKTVENFPNNFLTPALVPSTSCSPSSPCSIPQPPSTSCQTAGRSRWRRTDRWMKSKKEEARDGWKEGGKGEVWPT